MRPSAVSGMWVDQKLSSKHNLQAGWLYSMAPRGTSKWYSVAESIGFFPSGVNPDGSKSDYINKKRSRVNSSLRAPDLISYLFHFFEDKFDSQASDRS